MEVGEMPKEFIGNMYRGQHATSHGPDLCGCKGDMNVGDCAGKKVPLDDSVMKVSWMRDLNQVEIAILRDREDEHDETAWHSQFDRAGINAMIRLLRKARDGAFGADA